MRNLRKATNNVDVDLALAMSCIVACPTIARAQNTSEKTPAASPSDQQLETIVVTAQRRSQKLQDVPISIQAFNQKMLTHSGVNRLEDLPAVVSGITFARAAGGSATFIRGIGSNETAAGQEAPVSTYIDGVYIQSLWSNNTALKNVERVEVLKGPQGTLFGRNATGGLIQIITRDPSSTPSGEISFSAGNYQTYEVNAYATTGIAENLAADFTGYVRRQERGYGTNLNTGNDANFNNENTARTKWKYRGANTDVTFAADYSDIQDTRGLNRTLLPNSIGPNGYTYHGGFYDVDGNVDFDRRTTAYGASAQIDHDFGWAKLVSISAARQDRTHFVFDNDISPIPVSAADITYKNGTFSQELRLSSAVGSRNTWIVGAFYFHARSTLGLSVLAGPTMFTAARFDSREFTDSYSAFGEYGLAVGDHGRLTLGGRFTADYRKTRGSIFTTTLPDQKANWKEPTWRIVYDHHVTETAMLYASYNRGFKSGNFNLAPANQPAFAPEKLDAFEVGAKLNFFENRVQFNVSSFYYDYRDLQVKIVQGVTTFTVNAGSARIKGLEGDLTARVSRSLTLNASASYLDANYRSFRNSPAYVPAVIGTACPGTTTPATGGNCLVTVDASGNQMVRAPRFSGNVGATLQVPLASGEMTANARVSYRDGFPWDPDGRVRAKANTLLNAGVSWESTAGFSVGIRGENILGSKYEIYGGGAPTGDYYSAGSPATYMATV